MADPRELRPPAMMFDHQLSEAPTIKTVSDYYEQYFGGTKAPTEAETPLDSSDATDASDEADTDKAGGKKTSKP